MAVLQYTKLRLDSRLGLVLGLRLIGFGDRVGFGAWVVVVVSVGWFVVGVRVRGG